MMSSVIQTLTWTREYRKITYSLACSMPSSAGKPSENKRPRLPRCMVRFRHCTSRSSNNIFGRIQRDPRYDGWRNFHLRAGDVFAHDMHDLPRIERLEQAAVEARSGKMFPLLLTTVGRYRQNRGRGKRWQFSQARDDLETVNIRQIEGQQDESRVDAQRCVDPTQTIFRTERAEPLEL